MKRRNMLSLTTALFVSFIFVDIASAYYSPSLGRFLNRDPIGQPGAVLVRHVTARSFLPRDPIASGGSNLYAYVYNEPTGSVDPFGLKPETQCTIDGSLLLMTFDGETLTPPGVEAVSGLPVATKVISTERDYRNRIETTTKELVFDYSKARQGVKDAGPIPEGSYWIDVCEERSLWGGSVWSHGLRRNTWGDYSWSLHSDDGTDTLGRGGFFIHGGTEWGSKGCIDVRHNDDKVHALVQKAKKEACCCCYIAVIVRYAVDQVVKTEVYLAYIPIPEKPPWH